MVFFNDHRFQLIETSLYVGAGAVGGPVGPVVGSGGGGERGGHGVPHPPHRPRHHSAGQGLGP